MSEEEKEKLPHAEIAWFHDFKDMVDNGDIARMEGSTFKIYMILISYTNFATGMTFPRIELIAEKAGISERQTIKCVNLLVKIGYILKLKEGRRNFYAFPKRPEQKPAQIYLKERSGALVPGHIYVASNSAFPGILKIGRTTKSVESRMHDLSCSTSIHAPFVLEYSIAVKDVRLEHDIHRALDKCRVAPDKEYFKATLDSVVAVIHRYVSPTIP